MSLCTGIGGIDLAAEWAGFKTIAQCEIDEYASKVLAKNFKGAPNLHDIRTVTNERLAELGIDRKTITVLSAGFPCQPYSLAGKGLGDSDERDLWGKWQELSERFARAGLSAKIHPVCLPELIRDTLSEYLPTLPRWGIASDGEYGELVTSEHRIGGTECLLLPTPLASDAIRMRYSEESLRKVGLRRTQGEYKKAGCNLSEWVAVFPTPQAMSCGCTGARQKLKKAEENGIITEAERKGMQAGNGGKLNPTWVEWLMGFPTGWTDLDA